jgi:ATP-dependent Clp protease ATP-binding subunit ClpA
MGARPMARVVKDAIKKPLASELLFGELSGGGTVVVKVGEDDELTFSFEIEKAPA